jgi:hypothetical protein
MSPGDTRKVDLEWKKWVACHLPHPGSCTRLEDLRVCVHTLSGKIAELQERIRYVPPEAYALPALVNARQERILGLHFLQNYC